MSNNRVKRFLPQLAIAVLAMPLFAGWSSAAPISANGNHTLASPILSSPARNEFSSPASLSWQKEAPLTGSSAQAQQYQVQSFQPVTPTQGSFANPAFQRTWERTDKLVASGQVQRSWYWGPTPGASVQEDYAEGPGGKRLVQYFDKSRMEINNPAGDPNNPFFVTNGLLTVELISGKMQTGNSTYVDRYPADIPLASDSDDASAPTYLSFASVSNTPLGDHPATSRLAQNVTATIARDGTVGDDQTKSTYPKDNIIYFEQATKHNIPLAIWEFLNGTGPVYNSATGKTADGRLSDPWFYATGYPISEAYWAHVKIAGQMQDVLIQAFERRVVTYVPNGVPGFKVQMGNIGQHYYDWRYKDAGKPSNPPTAVVVATPTSAATQPPAATATTKPQPIPTTESGPNCAGVPAGQNTTTSVVLPGTSTRVAGNCGPARTIFVVAATGFQPGETVSTYVSLPNQAVIELSRFDANSTGALIIQLGTSPNVDPGVTGFTMEGLNSHSKAIAYFKVTAPPATPTSPPSGGGSCSPPTSRNGEARPNSGRAGDTLLILVRGFQQGEFRNLLVYTARRRSARRRGTPGKCGRS